jgi:5-methylcytosine-specific restriction endonuclease McrA
MIGIPKPTKRKRRKKPLGAKRRAAKARGTVDEYQLEEIINAYSGRCAYCGKARAEEWDHLVPIAKGGEHEAANLFPSCARCNRQKGTSTHWEVPDGHPFRRGDV